MIGVVMSPTGENEVRQLENSDNSFTIKISNEPGNSFYDMENLTVNFNPSQEINIKSAAVKQSTEVNAIHEISHAAQHDRVGTEQLAKDLQTPINADGTTGVSKEEQRATETEKQAGRELGVPTRQDYRDVERKK